MPLVTVNEHERETHPVGHAAQLTTHGIPPRPSHQVGDCIANERVGSDPLRREPLCGTKRHRCFLAVSPLSRKPRPRSV
jgi:hypothetical protein